MLLRNISTCPSRMKASKRLAQWFLGSCRYEQPDLRQPRFFIVQNESWASALYAVREQSRCSFSLTTFSTATQQWKPSTFEELAKTVQTGSLCALGKSAPNPVLSTLRYFRDEYIAHIRDKRALPGRRSLSSTASMRQSARSAVCAQENALLTQLPVQRQSPTN